MPTTRRLPVAPDELPDNDRSLDAEAAPHDEPDADGASHEARRRRIAERAYARAERRGFEPGWELDDWLAAEAEERDGGEPARRGAGAP
jgi:hypothetical protein